MFVRIDYGFTRDLVEMQSHGRVLNGNFLVGLQPTPHGPLRVEWEKSDDQLAVRIDVPEGVVAEFIDPLGKARTLEPDSVFR